MTQELDLRPLRNLAAALPNATPPIEAARQHLEAILHESLRLLTYIRPIVAKAWLDAHPERGQSAPELTDDDLLL